MKILRIHTDDYMRSTLSYGSEEFPFDYCLDNLTKYNNPSIGLHWHRTLEFSVVTEGVIHCTVGNQQVSLTAGDGLFLNSKSIHSFTTPSHGKIMHIFFSPEFLAPKDSLLYDKFVSPVLSSTLAYCKLSVLQERESLICKKIEAVCQLCSQRSDNVSLSLSIQVLQLWEAFWSHVHSQLSVTSSTGNGVAQVRLQQMLGFIHENYHQPIKLRDIAAAANISNTEALRCFTMQLDNTPVNYLNAYRLEKAKDRLTTTFDSISSISNAVGFSSPGYFCKAFKNQFGLTPKAFRETAR